MSESQVTALIENEKEWRRHLVTEISAIKEEQKKVREELHATQTSIVILKGKTAMIASFFALLGSGLGAFVDRFFFK